MGKACEYFQPVKSIALARTSSLPTHYVHKTQTKNKTNLQIHKPNHIPTSQPLQNFNFLDYAFDAARGCAEAGAREAF